MAKFLTGNELNSELEKLFESADEQIILISPYIKLHDRYASTLRTKKDNPKMKIIIVFGKNEEDLSRSMKQEDFNFFKEFPNIEIRYEKRLHAKYYSSESSAILTSMNLYNFSQDNNIEAGVMTKATLLGSLASNLMTFVTDEDGFDTTAQAYFLRVIEQSELLFKKEPEYESIMLGLSKKYKSSRTEVDKLTDFFANKPKYENNSRKDNSEKKPIVNEIKTEEKTETVGANKISSETKFLSTTALSKEVRLSSKDLFGKFEKLNWIERKNDDWVLTASGKNKGAQTKKGQYGEYIAWPDTIVNEIK
ncbi:MAG: hypothetical protein A3F72_04580 [Bacteroidetes bacterium RIFCSPLOWO2_12_FULL_35_15]|nr:MAG: hypothetical protein A3F72_04580 [Bacteroidetes bacterium RIFCSPLOWO2_12_FULL_35_15]